jgi:glycine/D-amino acid oxidase-like deaminating enzyme/nitrite reductase/ring-hydroxylating ferredoxin subunit
MSIKDRTDSVWETVSLPTFPELKEDLRTEVCVIGGGLSGVSIAYELAKRGKKVVLLESFRLGSGQSGRTTAHLSCQLEEEFYNLMKMHDLQTIRKFLEGHRSAIDSIESIVDQEEIACDFKRVNGYLFAGENVSEDFLVREREAALKCGLALDPVLKTPLLKKKLMGLRFADQAQFHPLKYMKGLIECLVDLGVTILESTRVTEIENPTPDISLIRTEHNFDIQADYVVVATDTPINNRFHIHTKQHAYRTYAITLELTREVENVLLWDTEDPYHYIRVAGNKLIIGGEDHRVGQNPESDPFTKLEAWTRANFDCVGEVVDKWSGQVYEPSGTIGYIGKNPGTDRNTYIATGYSGSGMTSAVIASHIIPNLIEKRFHPLTDIYDPKRPPLRNMTEFVKENLNVAIQYTDWLTGSEVKSEEEIPVDTGCLMRHGLTKDCVYHEEGDNFERKSAVCTHLGGIVHWNDIEKTWDCPAHGSRFNTHGTPIEGPAISELPET